MRWGCPSATRPCKRVSIDLSRKGSLSSRTSAPARYSAAVTSEEVGRQDLDLLVERVSDGQVAPLVAHLISRESISVEEIQELKRLVAEAEQRLTGRKRRK